MEENFYKLHFEHVRQFVAGLKDACYIDSIVLQAEYAKTKDPVPFKERISLPYKPIAEGEKWGEAWDNAWFHLTGTVPKRFAGKSLCLRVNVTGEALGYDEKGKVLYALTGGSTFSGNFKRERFMLDRNFKGGEKLRFWIEAACNLLWGVGITPDHPKGNCTGTAAVMRLCVYEDELFQLYCDMSALLEVMEELGRTDYRTMQMLTALEKTIGVYSRNPANAAAARKVLAPILKRPALASALTVCATGHAHIDVGWLWTTRESARKAARTFANQLNLIQKYPGYVFGASQPHLFREVKRNHPDLYARVKQAVKDGRWELQGGMWVEADANLISGESMVRQFLHGKNFFRDEFGVDVQTHWIPDVFGYSASMPQIAAKAGCPFFLTQKISWSQFNHFPYHTMRWRGIDGTELLAHFPPENTYNSMLRADKLMKAQNDFEQNGISDRFVSLFGIGDGGGGPDEEILEHARRFADWENVPKVRCGKAEEFFKTIEPQKAEFPVWDGELYLEYHRGTLTTQARTKRNNRLCEQNLTALEFLASLLPTAQYPAAELDEIWKTVLLLQFHDILPGSSIHEVYEQTEARHAEVLKLCEKLTQKTAQKLFRKDQSSLTAVNTLPYPISETVPLPEGWTGVTDEKGKPLPVQTGKNGKAEVRLTMKPQSIVSLRKADAVLPKLKKNRKLVLENERISYEFDSQGQLIRAVDRQTGRSLLSGPANVWTLYHDYPVSYDAWDIDIVYPTEVAGHPECVSVEGPFTGPVRSFMVFHLKYGKSTFRQEVSLCAGKKRLDFITEADWHERKKLLRTSFPVNLCAKEASYDIQYGYYKRPMHSNTPWDQAKFEAAGQRYADISEAEYGIALLNDCKYGYKIKENVLDLALLRSPVTPDWGADQGLHRFTYSFLPHCGALAESDVMAEAAALNRKPMVFDGLSDGKNGQFPCCAESDSVTWEVLKKAEKSGDRILRLTETKGKHSVLRLHLNRKGMKVMETDLLEWKNGVALPVKNDTVELAFQPFEIKTIRLTDSF